MGKKRGKGPSTEGPCGDQAGGTIGCPLPSRGRSFSWRMRADASILSLLDIFLMGGVLKGGARARQYAPHPKLLACGSSPYWSTSFACGLV